MLSTPVVVIMLRAIYLPTDDGEALAPYSIQSCAVPEGFAPRSAFVLALSPTSLVQAPHLNRRGPDPANQINCAIKPRDRARSWERNQRARTDLNYNPASPAKNDELFCLPCASGTQNNACRHANLGARHRVLARASNAPTCTPILQHVVKRQRWDEGGSSWPCQMPRRIRQDPIRIDGCKSCSA
jgi:hypothetical protein